MQNIDIISAIGRRLNALATPRIDEPLPFAILIAMSRLEQRVALMNQRPM